VLLRLLPQSLVQHKAVSLDSGNFKHVFPISFFFLISLWFEFRNKDGTVPISLKELEFIHNYALKTLAEHKFDDPFWSSTSVLCAIKPKFEAYLEGIDYRLKLLKKTPRERANDGNITVLVKGFLKEYVPSKTYQKQKATEIQIDLLMGDGICKLYGNCSKEVAQNMKASDPTHNEENIQALVTLAVMELQFMHGCDVDWNANKDQADGESEDVDSDDKEELDFASIDSTDVLSDEVWKDLDYPNLDEFVKCRESFALAILMFLSEELSCKYPKLSGQVHAGWKSAFGKPISFDQLIDRPDKISTMFTEDEEDWFSATIEHFVSTKTAEQLEDLGITDEQLEKLGISKPNRPPAAGISKPNRPPAAGARRVKSTPFLFRSTSGANHWHTAWC